MQPIDFDEAIERIIKQDARYVREAYRFVRDALDFTQERQVRAAGKISKGGKSGKGPKSGGRTGREMEITHVSGQELLLGIKDYALKEFGPMVPTVFEEWGIHTTADFGELVFNMVDASLLRKTEEDAREDFKDVFSFHEAFRIPFLPAAAIRAAGGSDLGQPH